MSDQDMDARLAAAGQRWRAANPDTAKVDIAAATDAEFIPLQFDEPVAAGRKPRRRHWFVAAAAAVLLAAGVAVGLAVAGGGNGPQHVAGPAGARGLEGTSWVLQSYERQDGNSGSGGAYSSSLTVQTDTAQIAFKDGKVTGSDGVNAFSGRYTVSGTTMKFSNLAIGAVGTTGSDPLLEAFHAVLDAEKVQYELDPSGALVLKAGPTTLTFAAASAALDHRWTLTSFTDKDGSQNTTADAWIEFAGQKVTGSDGCGPFSSSDAKAGGGKIDFGHLQSTLSACSPPAGSEVARLQGAFHAVLSGPTTYVIYPGKLALESGDVTLVFVAEQNVSPGPVITDRNWLPGSSWTFDSIEQGSSASSSASSGRPQPGLTFNGDGTGFTGNDGCNAINADLVIGDGTMRITRGIQTQMACPDDPQSGIISAALRGNVRWQISEDQLRITNAGATVVYVPAVEGAGQSSSEQTLAGRWTLNSDKAAFLEFGPNGSLTGSDGCNAFTAHVVSVENFKVQLSDLTVPSPKPCPSGPGVTAVLDQTPSWRIDAYQLVLKAGGKELWYSRG